MSGSDFIRRKAKERLEGELSRIDVQASGSSGGSWFIGQVSTDKKFITKPDGTILNLVFTGNPGEFVVANQVSQDTAYAPANPPQVLKINDGGVEKGFVAIVGIPTSSSKQYRPSYIKDITKDQMYEIIRTDVISDPNLFYARYIKFTPDGKSLVDALGIFNSVSTTISIPNPPGAPQSFTYNTDSLYYKVRFIKNYTLDSETLTVSGDVSEITTPILNLFSLGSAPTPTPAPNQAAVFTNGLSIQIGNGNPQNFNVLYPYKYTDENGDSQIGVDLIDSFHAYGRSFGKTFSTFNTSTSLYEGFYSLTGMTSAGSIGTISVPSQGTFFTPVSATRNPTASGPTSLTWQGGLGFRTTINSSIFKTATLQTNTALVQGNPPSSSQVQNIHASPYFNLISSNTITINSDSSNTFITSSDLYAFRKMDFSTYVGTILLKAKFVSRAAASTKFFTLKATSITSPPSTGKVFSTINSFHVSESLPVVNTKAFSGSYPVQVNHATSLTTNLFISDIIVKRV